MRTNQSKKIKELKAKILSLEFQEVETLIKRSLPEPVMALEQEGIKAEKRRQFDLLAEAETRYLIRKAESWGIEVRYSDKNHLNTLEKAVINRHLREVRFAYWKGWSEILVPILSLVIAILALLKG